MMASTRKLEHVSILLLSYDGKVLTESQNGRHEHIQIRGWHKTGFKQEGIFGDGLRYRKDTLLP